MTDDTKRMPPESLTARRAACERSDKTPEHGSVLVPMHGMSVIHVDGDDAQSFLQSKLTTDLNKLEERGAAYGYAVDINGRILFDVHIAKPDPTSFRLWSEPNTASKIIEALDRYIIMEDVRLTEIASPEQWLVASDDPDALDRALNVAFEHASGVVEKDEVQILAMARSARPARLLDGPSEGLRASLVDAGAGYVSWEDWRAYEIASGFVRTGVDLLPEQTIPLEVGSDLGIDYNKGCYLGQEVIERLRSRGTPNREYRRVRANGAVEQAPVDLVNEKGRNAGTLTSIVPDGDVTHGIAVIRRRALNDESGAIYVGDVDGPQIDIVGAVR